MFYSTNLKRIAVVELNAILRDTKFDYPINSRFRYMVTKNLETTQMEVNEINAAFPKPKGLNEYLNKKGVICKKYNVKNVVDDKIYKELPAETKKSLDDEINKLDEEYKELIKEVKTLEKEKSEFLEEEVPIKLYKIDIDLVPNISQQNKYNGWDIWFILLRHVIIEPKD